MIDIDETEKQVKLLQSKSFIRMQLDLPEVLELIERVRQAEARIAELQDAGRVMVKDNDRLFAEGKALEARIAEAAKLHRRKRYRGDRSYSFVCEECTRINRYGIEAWPCPTADALGLSEGSET